MARVGFRGLGKYQDLKLAELDQRADKLADRLDALVERGGTAIEQHAKHLDMREAEIADYEKAAIAHNGGPPLDDSAGSPPRSGMISVEAARQQSSGSLQADQYGDFRRGGFETAHTVAQREAQRR